MELKPKLKNVYKAFKTVDGKQVEIEVVKVGDKFIEVDGYKTVAGKKTPKMKVTSFETINEHGGTDMTIQVPYLSVSVKENTGAKQEAK